MVDPDGTTEAPAEKATPEPKDTPEPATPRGVPEASRASAGAAGRRPKAHLGSSGPVVASRRPGSALSLGIAAGAVTVVPAGIVWLGSVMAGEPGPAALAFVLPLAVGAVTALVALIGRRPRAS
jgi:hypothetical protein